MTWNFHSSICIFFAGQQAGVVTFIVSCFALAFKMNDECLLLANKEVYFYHERKIVSGDF
jgi:hypothetical protein